MERPWPNWVTTILSVAALIAGLAALDPLVRDELAAIADGQRPTGALATVGQRAEELALVTIQVVRDQTMSHAQLTIFVLAAAVLLVLMLRT